MTAFNLISHSVNHPVVFYDGGESEVVDLSARIAEAELVLQINLSAPECRQWRHYYTDPELNDLWSMLGLRFRFLVNSECLVEPNYGRSVYFQPFLNGNQEISVCFCYDEVSYGHYMYWLLGLVARPMEATDHGSRVKHIEQYWSNGRRGKT